MISHSLVLQSFKAQQLRDIRNYWGGGGILAVNHMVFKGNGGGNSRRQQSIKEEGGLNR